MGYTNRRATIKWCDPDTKKLKYFSYANFDEHNNKFDNRWSPDSELMIGTNISTPSTLKIDLSDHPFIIYYIFEVNTNFPPIICKF